MSLFKCGRCNKSYTTEEWINLKKVKMRADDPKGNYGFTAQCACGYVFHKDKWILKQLIRINGIMVNVSTIFLEVEHTGMWYETMVFIETNQKRWHDQYCDRYLTKKQAVQGHNEVLQKIIDGRYKLTREDKEWVLNLI